MTPKNIEIIKPKIVIKEGSSYFEIWNKRKDLEKYINEDLTIDKNKIYQFLSSLKTGYTIPVEELENCYNQMPINKEIIPKDYVFKKFNLIDCLTDFFRACYHYGLVHGTNKLNNECNVWVQYLTISENKEHYIASGLVQLIKKKH
jgi:hypothetical protein